AGCTGSCGPCSQGNQNIASSGNTVSVIRRKSLASAGIPAHYRPCSDPTIKNTGADMSAHAEAVSTATLDDTTRSNMRKVALTSLAGTSIEWYDFFLYGTAAAIVFPVLFFPADMPAMVALIASFSTFAVGFLARPLGGVIFGHYGDRIGRKKVLVIALMMMGVATTLIGLLPGYAMAGPLAPILLVILRFVQGLAIGGQWGGAMLLVTETAPANRRGWYGAFAQAGAPIGVILANLAFLIISFSVSEEAFLSWGWRIP